MGYTLFDVKAFVVREVMKADYPRLWLWYLQDAIADLEHEIRVEGLEAALAKYLPTDYDWPPEGQEDA